jgi:exosome complex component CSL4
MKLIGRKNGTFIVPGDYLGVIEEFLPGGGTYIDDGTIYSSTTGHLLVDSHKRKISVYQKTKSPLLPKEGAHVIGRITSIHNKTLNVKIFQIRDKLLSNTFNGIMHITDVRKGYVKTMLDAFQIGDIIRAKVMSTKNREFHLSTQENGLGVITSKCSFCGYKIILSQNRLKCPQCNKTKWRKMASDYGKEDFIKLPLLPGS